MGRTTSPTSSGPHPETTEMTSKDHEDWQNISLLESDELVNSTRELSQSPPPTTSKVLLNEFQHTWQLPLQSLVLDTPCHELPVNFLGLYLVILEKFPGPPCEALGRTISYLLALVTQSPAFHPYIAHMPFGRLPVNKSDAVATVDVLEQNLIRVLQNLFRLFPSDPNIIQQYITTCPAELIPPPRFVILPNSHPAWLPKVFPRGVEGFNNNTKDGELVWQSPQYRCLQESILSSNIEKCRTLIQRTNLTFPPQRPPQKTNIHSRQKPSAPSSPFSNLQLPNSLSIARGLPELPPMLSKSHISAKSQNVAKNSPSFAAEIYQPQSMFQMQVPGLPQPYAAPTHHTLPLASSPIPIMRVPQPSPQTSLPNPFQEQLKRDIERLESELSRLAETVNRSANKP